MTIGAFLAGGLLTLPLLIAVPVTETPRLADYAYLLVLGAIMSGVMYILYPGSSPESGPPRRSASSSR